jgi:SOS-response transcriptional repressor LexA
MDDDILKNIERRLEVVGKSASAASSEAGLSPDAIRNMKRSASKGHFNVTVETLQKLAPVLRTTVAKLLAPYDSAPTGDDQDEAGEIVPIRPRMVPVPVVGSAQAGMFYEVDDMDQSDLDRLYLPPDERFPRARQIAFEVRGDSMNDLKPRPLVPGDKAICVSYEDIADQMPIITGMVVVVERTRDGGHTREWSVKQVELYADRIEFHPRSTNPRHKPIVVKRDAFADEGVSVEIIALVRRAVSDFPLS